MIKLVAFDLDGTIGDTHVPQSLKKGSNSLCYS